MKSRDLNFADKNKNTGKKQNGKHLALDGVTGVIIV